MTARIPGVTYFKAPRHEADVRTIRHGARRGQPLPAYEVWVEGRRVGVVEQYESTLHVPTGPGNRLVRVAGHPLRWQFSPSPGAWTRPVGGTTTDFPTRAAATRALLRGLGVER